MKRALFIGRFQPFHNGHMQGVELALRECDELIIVVGSVRKAMLPDDPFTCGERIEMIRRSMQLRLTVSKDITERIIIIPVDDIDYYPVWVRHVEATCPKFDVVCSGNKFVLRLFEEAGYETVMFPHFTERTITGTAIREKIVAGESWAQYVPMGTRSVILEEGLDKRLRAITQYGGRGE